MLPLLAHCGLGQALAIRLWPCGDRGVGRIWGPGAGRLWPCPGADTGLGFMAAPLPSSCA